MPPLVSVVMSIYSPNEQFLRKQLATIDAQDWENLEIIVYNDNPKDANRQAFCQSVCTNHPVRYYHGSKNVGYRHAFEKLVQLAKGDYIAFSDQDDVWLPGRISECVSVMEEGGFMLATCDRQIIDGEDAVVCESWRAEHLHVPQDSWRTGDHFVPYAAFACYSIGMATMVRADAALRSLPFPDCTAHDKWLALCCAQMGSCAFVEKPLVQYRRHGHNVSGTFTGISSKADWYRYRTEPSYQVVATFASRFPLATDLPRMRAFAEARRYKRVRGIWRNRELSPQVARFEIVLALVPDALFRLFLRVWVKR